MFIEIILLGRAFIFLATKKREYKFRTNFGNKYLDNELFYMFSKEGQQYIYLFLEYLCKIFERGGHIQLHQQHLTKHNIHIRFFIIILIIFFSL